MAKTAKKPNLSVIVGRMNLKNPVIVASGTFGFAEEYADFLDLDSLGAIVTKGISLKPMMGNPPPRIFETKGGVLNSIGLQNPGFDVFVKTKLPFLRKIKAPVIVNFFGNSQSEYVELARRFDHLRGISGLEMNISCPNVEQGGIAFCMDPKMTYEVVRAVRKSTGLTLIVKLSPNVTDISQMARSAEDAGADAVSLVNTFKAMAVNIHSGKPELGNITGGLSGPAIKPIALRMVWEVSQVVKIPVIGMGGIWKAHDAIEFMLVGATAVQIGTANLINPKTAQKVIDGIEKYLLEKKMDRIHELTGLFLKSRL